MGEQEPGVESSGFDVAKMLALSNLLVQFGLVFLRRPLASGPTLSRDVKKCRPRQSVPGRVAGGHFRRAQLLQFAHGCNTNRVAVRGDILAERIHSVFSVPLVPFERAIRTAGRTE